MTAAEALKNLLVAVRRLPQHAWTWVLTPGTQPETNVISRQSFTLGDLRVLVRAVRDAEAVLDTGPAPESDTGELEKRVGQAVEEPDPEFVCSDCRCTYSPDFETIPSVFCHPCAQAFITEVTPKLLVVFARFRQAEIDATALRVDREVLVRMREADLHTRLKLQCERDELRARAERTEAECAAWSQHHVALRERLIDMRNGAATARDEGPAERYAIMNERVQAFFAALDVMTETVVTEKVGVPLGLRFPTTVDEPFRDVFNMPSETRVVARCGILRLPGYPEGEVAIIEDVRGFSVQSAAGEVLTRRGRWVRPDAIEDGEEARWSSAEEARAAISIGAGSDRSRTIITIITEWCVATNALNRASMRLVVLSDKETLAHEALPEVRCDDRGDALPDAFKDHGPHNPAWVRWAEARRAAGEANDACKAAVERYNRAHAALFEIVGAKDERGPVEAFEIVEREDPSYDRWLLVDGAMTKAVEGMREALQEIRSWDPPGDDYSANWLNSRCKRAVEAYDAAVKARAAVVKKENS